jgi:FkbH-like protein
LIKQAWRTGLTNISRPELQRRLRFSDLRKNLKRDYSTFPTVKIAIFGDTPTQFLHQAIAGYAYELAINPLVYEAEPDQIDLQLRDTTSELYRFRPEYVVVFQSTQRLLSHFYETPSEQKRSFADLHLKYVQSMCDALKSRLEAHLIYCNFAEIDDAVYGNYANKTDLSFLYQTRALNVGLMKLAVSAGNLFIADLAALQNREGRRNIVSNMMYMTAGFAYSLEFWTEVARQVLSIIQSLRGRFHKAVILDLDNTLWGGTVGDDGLEHIQIGDLGIGRAFSELQAWLKQLKERGIILAVCSKNDEQVAQEVFERHPDMVLRLDDIAVFVANWGNKVDNINYIQAVINIGFESIVYLDDSPFERRMVKHAIPALTVPELPEDPADYLDELRSLNLFETASLSHADSMRTRQYQEEAQRVSLLKTYDSEEAFLASLGMVSEARAFDGFHIPRIAQLTQRSNQFNLRTVRYTERDVERIMNDPQYLTLYFTLNDEVGDYGLVSIVVLRGDEGFVFIENWLMSCRVLKRGMEDFVLNNAVRAAKKNGYTKIIGEYIPSQKNQLVRNHYPNMGFVDENGLWKLELDRYVPRKTYIKLG